MSAHFRRLESAATAIAYDQLRDLAPRLSELIYCAAVPERQLRLILDWSADIGSPETGDALSMERLRAVAPALVVAFVAAHAYSLDKGQDERGHSLKLRDLGGGATVGDTLAVVAVIAVDLHGEEGRDIVKAAGSDLAAMLSRVAAMIGAR